MNVYLGYGKSSTYLVRVEGNSMAGAGIHHGSTLVVDRSLPPRQDSIVLAIVDDDFTIRYWRRRQGGLFLEAARKGCPPIDMQQHRVEIWGVVTHSILKY